jgi:ribonuclease D
VVEARTSLSRWQELSEQLITGPHELTACCEHLAACRRFGFDTEFVGEDTYHPRLCLLQVATEDTLYLIDPLSVGPLDAFWRVVVDPANLVIVHAGREEVRLCHLWSGQVPGNLFDLQIAAGLAGLPYPLGHGNLVSQVLGVHLSKGETLTEWRNRPLTRAQIHYAFDDVRYLLPLWEHLSARLEALGRLSWAREEFGRLKENATPETPAVLLAGDRWRKLRGLGSLDRRRLAVVRELYAWREEAAARANRPARSIVRDDLLVEIARRGPTKERDLQVVRGLPRRSMPGILEAVERARALPLQDCPVVSEREQDISQVGMVVHLLMAVFGDLCARLGVASNLVASGQDLKALVKARYQGAAPPADSLLTAGWRAEHILPALQAVLEGRRGVRVADLNAAAPLAYAEADESDPRP